MAVPDYQSLMLPLLRYAALRDADISSAEAIEALASEFHLTAADREELLESGTQSRFANRVGWAATYVKKAGLLEPAGRGRYRITKRGHTLLQGHPGAINVKTLQQYPEFLAFQNLRGTRSGKASTQHDQSEVGSQVTPSEALEAAYENLRAELADDLLTHLKNTSPAFFEQAVVDLLVRMGYGGSRADAGRAIGKSGDEGVDGIIKEDRLGLDLVFIQAKRWAGKVVSRADCQQFAGALAGQKASKGIFITTSTFADSARRYVSGLGGVKIVLLDGRELTDLMIEHEVGVSTVATYPVKKVDSDYFDESL
jgi:restriction system protein